MSQVCSTCGEEKPPDAFPFRNKGKGIRHKICKQCHSDYRRRHYLENRTTYLRKAKRWNAENRHKRRVTVRRYIIEYLMNNPCVDCGEADPVVLEFDHVRGEKQANVSELVMTYASLETVKAEIAKCEVRCANCHRRRTARQHNAWVIEYRDEYLQGISQSGDS